MRNNVNRAPSSVLTNGEFLNELDVSLIRIQRELYRYWCAHLAFLPGSDDCDPLQIVSNTDEDKVAIRIISEELTGRFDAPIIMEDTPTKALDHSSGFLIDPLDATHNVMAGFPFFTCSIAYIENGECIFGWVFDISRDVVYRATLNQGAFISTALGERKLITRRTEDLQRAMVSVFRGNCSSSKKVSRYLFENSGRVRLTGCSSLDICNIASGALDVFYDPTLKGREKLCDVAGSLLILSEAGGIYTTNTGDAFPSIFLNDSAITTKTPVVAVSNHILYENICKRLDSI